MSNESLKNKFENSKDFNNNNEQQDVIEIENKKSVEEFGVEKIKSIDYNIQQAEKSIFEDEKILDLGGDPKEVKEITGQIDLEINKVGEKTKEEIIKWIKLENQQFDENKYYRIVDEEGFKDFVLNKVVRSKSIAKPGDKFKKGSILESINERPATPFPSFAKGAPDLRYTKKGEENYILESDILMYKQGDTNKQGKRVAGKHWAYRPLDESGNYKKEITKNEISNVYKIDKEGNLYKKESE